jgi:hypothetical protein
MVHDMQGIPKVIVSDGSGEQTGTKWRAEINMIRARHHLTEPASPWQNRAEREIGEIKRGIRRATKRARSPKRLWDYCGQWVVAIRRMTAHDLPELDGMPPEEAVHNRMADISAYAQFDWYEYVWYIDRSDDATQSTRKLGRWIGVAENQGAPMTYMVLPASCRPVARSSVFPLTQDDRLSAVVQAQMVELDTSITEKIGDARSDDECFADFPEMPELPEDIFLDDDPAWQPVEDTMPEADDHYSPEAYDQYLMASILMDRSGEAILGTVKNWKRDSEGNPVGRSNMNPLLDPLKGIVPMFSGPLYASKICSKICSKNISRIGQNSSRMNHFG